MLILRKRKKERLCSQPQIRHKKLYKDGQFGDSAINAELYFSPFSGYQSREEHFVQVFIDNERNIGDHDGETVKEHTPEQRSIDTQSQLEQFGNEQQIGRASCRERV